MASSNAMGNCVLLVASFLIFFSLSNYTAKAQEPSTTGYNCTAGRDSGYPCRAYAFYRASAPSLLDLAAVGDLFSVSRLMISQPSNISTPSAALVAGQPLLIPLTCGCFSVPNISATTNHSYAPLNRTIISGDTFYLVSTNSYRNLTTYQSVEVVNPTLVPTNLSVGDNVIFPIFCKCPDRNRSLQGNASTSFLISYVFQPSDNLSSVATQLGSDARSIAAVNGLASTSTPVQPFTTIFIPVSRLPTLAQQTAPSPSASPQPSPPTAATERKVERTGAIVGLGVALGIIGAIAVIVLGFWIYREGLWRKRLGESERAEEEWQKEKLVMAGGGGGRSESTGVVKAKGLEFGLDVSECLDKYRVFKIAELTEATDGFDQSCLVQGSVYKGTMGGTVYAIKKMKWNAYEELKILQKVNHGNLVKLEGFCIDPEDANCYLVYEYVENGSLHSWLHGNNNDNNHSSNVGQKLRWKSRLKIAIDVANGLQYIHEHTRPRVVHKDVKASNILLDANMRAKIANFGLAKSGCNAITMHIVGTQGYIAPEYLADGVVSTKMDVFSFGVVLLELISGREAIDEDGRLLSATAAGVLQGATEEEKALKLRGWMDGAIAKDDSCSIESVMSVMSVAVACLHRDPAKRPSMVEIVYALCKSDDDGVFDTSEEALSGGSVSAR